MIPQSYDVKFRFPPELQLLFEKFNSKLKVHAHHHAHMAKAPENKSFTSHGHHNTESWNMINPELYSFLRCPVPQ